MVQGPCDVLFDGQHVWSFSPADREPDEDGFRFFAWPRVMRTWLDGNARVSVAMQGREIYSAELQFGSAQSRIRFVDKRGIPVMIDKWGLLQRPFAGRGRRVVDQMVDATAEILQVLERECGVRAWIAFGTLLGAARERKVIGHDSDIDLAYLSDEATPAAMARELFEMSRALRRAGMRVMNKSGSFVTVLFTGPDGGQSSIDIYTCFYIGDLLYETATVRAPVARSAIEPLTALELEGRLLPAPADPDVLLTASYGPSWRVPDPSFTHRPGPQIKERFDPWFGSVMRHRRDWERSMRAANATRADWKPSGFARWVRGRLEPGVRVLDVGTGAGVDALSFAAAGWDVVGLDYARGAARTAVRRATRRGLPAAFESLNLYDLRDVMTRAALLAREEPAQRAVYARALLETLEPDGRENFWRFGRMLLSGGGKAYVEFGGPAAPPGPTSGGRRFGVTPELVAADAAVAGARVVESGPARGGVEGGAPRWRMTLQWSR